MVVESLLEVASSYEKGLALFHLIGTESLSEYCVEAEL